MLLQKGCILMYLLDNGCAGYTWREEWNIPYESIWGRMEKFRAINVLEPGQLDKVIRIGADSLSTIFSRGLLIYRKQSYNISKKSSFLEIDADIFDNFTHVNGFFESRLRYCPLCMKNGGYHSFLHQLSFLDTCYIHTETYLKYRCSCPNTYVLKRKRPSEVELFQCELCKEKISIAPSLADGIINSWGNSNISKRLRRTSNYKSIHVLDVWLTQQEKFQNFHMCSEFSTMQKSVLKDIILAGKTDHKPRLIIEKKSEKIFSKIVMSNLLNQYLLNKYEDRTLLRHFAHISNRFYRYEIEDYNIEIFTIFFLMRELQCKSNVDELKFSLHKNSEGNAKKEITSDHKYSDVISVIYDVFSRMQLEENEYIELYNIILKEFTLARFEHIYSCFHDNYPENYPCTSSDIVSYTGWNNYPVYVIIKTNDDKILLY